MALKPANKYKTVWQCHNFKNIPIDSGARKAFSKIMQNKEI